MAYIEVLNLPGVSRPSRLAGEEPVTEASIRQATTSDLPALSEIEDRWRGEEITWGFVQATKGELALAVQAGCFVAETNGSVVGYASSSLHTSEGLAVIPKGERYLVLDNLYVLPEYRDAGLGRRLTDAVEKWAREEGAKAILVYSATKDMHRITRFYESCGFTSWFVQLFKDLR
jgi:ribosomal protein S18 acetylase RimI-like enzyme